MPANINSAWENGCLVFRDASKYIVDVQAPIKAVLNTALDTNGWTVAGVNSGAMAATLGVQTISTGNADDDDVDVATGLIFNPAKGLSIEGRLRNDDVDPSALNFGFSDATGEAADKIAFTFATATLTTNASDAALFFHDADATTDLIRCATVGGDTDSTVIASSTTPADGTEYKFRIDIAPTGYATFYLDDVNLGTADQIVTTTTPLCAYIGYITREGAVNTCDIVYAAAWQWTR